MKNVKQPYFGFSLVVLLTCMRVSVRNLSREVCRWHGGRRPHLSIPPVFAKWAECGTAVGECVCVWIHRVHPCKCVCLYVCVCTLPGKRAYQHTDHIDWKIGRKKVRRAKPGDLQNERASFDVCLHSFQCWWKGSCWTVVVERNTWNWSRC